MRTNPLRADAAGITLVDFGKTFGGTTALQGVSTTFRRGTVTAVLGENGAGKSTLFKILAGFHEPDSGARLFVDGVEHALPLHPSSAAHLGFAFVHQDLALAPSLTVMENVCVGALPTRFGLVDWRGQARLVRRLLDDLGSDIEPHATVLELTQAERATVAIARAIYARGRGSSTMLVLDEPTANLTGTERDQLFAAMRRAADAGAAVLFCTHRLDEVLIVADEVVVLRDGRLVAQLRTAELSGEAELVRHILGRELDELVPNRSDVVADGAVQLEVVGLGGGGIAPMTFHVRAGEVVGITGLAGAGQDVVPMLLFGDIPRIDGHIKVGGRAVASLSPGSAIRAGMAMLPADRKRLGGVAAASIRENFSLVTLDRFTKLGVIQSRTERAATRRAMESYDVRSTGSPDQLLGALSGGNQQKVLLAKWLTREGVSCVVLHEPTQGIDIGAKAVVLNRLADLAAAGMAVVLISSEHEELAGMCQRVLVMSRGELVAELHHPDAKQIAAQCYRVQG